MLKMCTSFFLIIVLTASSLAIDCTEAMKVYFSGSNKVVLSQKTVSELKALKRTGWLNHNIPELEAESVWQHSLKVEKATVILLRNFPVNVVNRAGQIARVHDVAESLVGDYTPHDNITDVEKFNLEYRAIQAIAEELDDKRGKILVSLWKEYEDQGTLISRYVKDLDKIDASVQAMVYLKRGYKTDDFFPYALKVVKTPELNLLFQQLLSEFNRNREINPYKRYFELLNTLNLTP